MTGETMKILYTILIIVLVTVVNMSIEITDKPETFPVNGTPDFKWNASSWSPYVTDVLQIEQPTEQNNKVIDVMRNGHFVPSFMKYNVAATVGRQYTLQLRGDIIYVLIGFANGPYDQLLTALFGGEVVRLGYNKVGTNYTLISEERLT